MKNKICFLIIFSMLFAQPVLAVDFDSEHLINLRYSGVLCLNTNYTYQMVFNNLSMFPLQAQAGIGTGGYKIGIGCGLAGTPDSWSDDLKCGYFGAGLKISYLKVWEDNSFSSAINKRNIGGWVGVELSIAALFGLDIGYYKSITDSSERLNTVNIGFFY